MVQQVTGISNPAKAPNADVRAVGNQAEASKEGKEAPECEANLAGQKPQEHGDDCPERRTTPRDGQRVRVGIDIGSRKGREVKEDALDVSAGHRRDHHVPEFVNDLEPVPGADESQERGGNRAESLPEGSRGRAHVCSTPVLNGLE